MSRQQTSPLALAGEELLAAARAGLDLVGGAWLAAARRTDPGTVTVDQLALDVAKVSVAWLQAWGIGLGAAADATAIMSQPPQSSEVREVTTWPQPAAGASFELRVVPGSAEAPNPRWALPRRFTGNRPVPTVRLVEPVQAGSPLRFELIPATPFPLLVDLERTDSLASHRFTLHLSRT